MANSRLIGQEIPRLLCNPKFHCHIPRSLPTDTILSQLNTVSLSFRLSLKVILMSFFHLGLCLPSVLLESGFPTKIFYAFFMFPMRASRSVRLIVLNYIWYEEYKL